MMKTTYGRVALFVLLALLLPIACYAKGKPVDRGEGTWGLNGVPMVTISNIHMDTSYMGKTLMPFGDLRNISGQPIQNIVVTAGDHENGDTIIFGTDTLSNTDLNTNEVWRWSVTAKNAVSYEVLRISVNGQLLTRQSTTTN